MEIELLERLGLTKNEVRVYLHLLKSGISTTGPIMNELGISSSRVYASLQELIKKGLVTYFVRNNTKYYHSESPDYLLKITDELKSNLVPLVDELKKLKKPKEEGEYSMIFEGFNGFKQAFEILLKECSKEDGILTIGFSPPDFGLETLRIFLKKVDRERYKRKVPMKIIFDVNMKDTIGKDREQEPYTEVRYLPRGYITPAALSIFKDYVIHWVWRKKKIIAFLIKSKEVNESFRNYFELLWKLAKP